MKLIGSLALAGLTCCVSATALSAADYYVQATTPGPVTGTPLAVVNLQAELKQPAMPVTTPTYESEAAGRKSVVTDPRREQQANASAPVAPTTAAVTNVQTVASVGALSSPLPGTTYSSFNALLQSGKLTGGDRVFLLDGYHGQIAMNNLKFSSPVTIAGMPGQTAQVEGINVFGSTNIIFRDLKVWDTTPNTGSIAGVRTYGGASDITFTNLDVRSVANAGNYMQWTLADWNANKRGGFLVDGPRISIIGNRVTGTAAAIFALGPNALIENNTIDGWGDDGMRALGDNSVVRGNKLQNCFHISANHDDGFQSFSRGPTGAVGAGTVSNLTIENNKIYEWRSSSTNPLRCKLQGIGMFDGMYANTIIRNNVISVSGYHGITIAGAKGAKIVQNTVINPSGAATTYPFIKVSPHKNGTLSSDVTAANNTANNILVKANSTRRNVVVNNIVVTNPATEFTSIKNQDYTLLATAKSANAGTPTYATPVDIMGVARPKGKAPDAGAYESQ